MSADVFAGILPFVRTAEEHSFTRAASSIGITTAAVSKSVRRLEESLGVRLLERSSRVVKLTREGELFYQRCRQAVVDVHQAREEAQGSRRVPQGELSVTMPFIVAPLVVPRLARLSAQYPQLAFRIHMTDRIARLADEDYDLAIRMGEPQPSSFIARRLRETRWMTVASPAYLARKPAPIRIEDLADHDCLQFLAPNGKPRDWTFVAGERKVTQPVNGPLVIDQGSFLVTATQAGMGICQVLDFMVDAAIREGSVVEVLADAAAPGPSIYAVATPNRARSTNVRTFIRFLVETFQA